MKVFFDLEFTGLHQHTTLISLGMIAETERTFYAETRDYDESQIDDWIRENVIGNLLLGDRDTPVHAQGRMIAQTDAKCNIENLAGWVKQWYQDYFPNEMLQFIGDCPHYDWVLFCELFGGALSLPDFISPMPVDLNQMLADYKNITVAEAFDVGRESFAFETDEEVRQFGADFEGIQSGNHNALWDAKVIKACYEKIVKGNTSSSRKEKP